MPLPRGNSVVLGSQSAQRRALLIELLGDRSDYGSPVFCKADIDERAIGDRHSGDVQRLTVEIAKAKAKALLPSLQADHRRPLLRWLITGDTVVEYQGQVREKPVGREQAVEFVRSYGLRPCSTVSGFVVTDIKTGRQVTSCCPVHPSIHPSVYPTS